MYRGSPPGTRRSPCAVSGGVKARWTARKSPDILLDARDLPGEPDAEARALLFRAARLARYPVEPEREAPR
jgi:hypothetical protein